MTITLEITPELEEVLRRSAQSAGLPPDSAPARIEWESFGLYACVRGLVGAGGFNRETAAAMDALADPAVRTRLTGLGQEIPPREQQTAEALAAHQKAEIEKWWPLIKAANIKAE